MEKKQKKMSRRSFIGGVATGAASIAIGGNLLKTTLTSSMLPPSLGIENITMYRVYSPKIGLIEHHTLS
jgi:hypothetical protein